MQKYGTSCAEAETGFAHLRHLFLPLALPNLPVHTQAAVGDNQLKGNASLSNQ